MNEDAKSKLNRISQKSNGSVRHLEYPREERGPQHNREFLVTVTMHIRESHRSFCGEWKSSRKAAEQSAAEIAVEALEAAGYRDR